MNRLAVCSASSFNAFFALSFTLLSLSGHPAPAIAATLPADPSPGVPLQKVEVAGKAATDAELRRDDTAARVVVGREEIARHGDTSLAGVLKRQGGVAVNGNDIRLRGLGAGYTQLLINGDPAPPGFSIDSIAPGMVERIDILRSGSAELGAQAIAGTINIILKKAGGTVRRDVKLGVGSPGRADPSLAANWGARLGTLAWSMGAELSRTGIDNRLSYLDTSVDASLGDGTVNLGADLRWSDRLSLGANLNLQFGGATRVSAALRSEDGPVRALDLFGVWKIDAATRLRLGAANALHPVRRSALEFDDGALYNARSTSAASPAVVKLLLEKSL